LIFPLFLNSSRVSAAKTYLAKASNYDQRHAPSRAHHHAMNAIAIALALLVLMVAIVLFYRMRRLAPQKPGYASQRMCPACGLITPRSHASCLECGRLLIAPASKP
jgi:hypothetical protein